MVTDSYLVIMLRSRRSILAILLTSLAGFSAGCGDDETSNPSPTPTDMEVTLSNFGPDSPVEGHYQLWIAFALLRPGPEPRHSEAASAGKFRINANGVPVDLAGNPIEFEISPNDPNVELSNGEIAWQLAVDAFVTLEPDGDDDGDPRLPGIIAGSFLSRSATLSVNETDAIDVELSGVAGAFHLATPTTGSTTDETEGVWFAAPGGASASLVLPTLTVGTLWTYEAWVRHPSAGTASLGALLSASGVDQDGAGPLGGSGFPFPGSDFPFGAAGTDLSSSTVFVTLEPPYGVDGPSPFFLEILRAPMSGAASGTPIAMSSLPVGLPTGSVELPR